MAYPNSVTDLPGIDDPIKKQMQQTADVQQMEASLIALAGGIPPFSVATPVYGTSVAIDSNNKYQLLTATDGVAFAIGAPAHAAPGKELVISIYNNTVGALGAITWNGVYQMPTFTRPATTKTTTVAFVYTGTKWQQVGAQSPDM